MTAEEFMTEYRRLGHAVQTGAAFEMGALAAGADGADTLRELGAASPKHLRTGLSCVMADLGSLTRLLVAKGVITNEEYFEAILDGLRRKVEDAEARLSAQSGVAIKLS